MIDDILSCLITKKKESQARVLRYQSWGKKYFGEKLSDSRCDVRYLRNSGSRAQVKWVPAAPMASYRVDVRSSSFELAEAERAPARLSLARPFFLLFLMPSTAWCVIGSHDARGLTNCTWRSLAISLLRAVGIFVFFINHFFNEKLSYSRRRKFNDSWVEYFHYGYRLEFDV